MARWNGDEDSFSIRLPVAKLLAVADAAAGDELDSGDWPYSSEWAHPSVVLFGQTADGNLLFQGPAGTASLTVSN